MAVARKTVKKKTARKAAKKKTARKTGSRIQKRTQGYIETESGILLPKQLITPVKASKLKTGFSNAKKEIDKVLQEIVSSMKGEYKITEIELVASFSADGKFMGFGVGGAASIKIKIAPEK